MRIMYDNWKSLILLQEQMVKVMDQSLKSIAIFFQHAKVVDTESHQILLNKLDDYGI